MDVGLALPQYDFSIPGQSPLRWETLLACAEQAEALGFGSVWLSATANGIAVFMLFGAGLVAGLLGQLGEALGSDTLIRVADRTSWALPFEALYQAALSAITADTVGYTRLAIDLGPFGGGQHYGSSLPGWSIAYLALVGLAAAWGFRRVDL